MFKSVILISLVAYASAGVAPAQKLPQLDGRIVGGRDTTIDRYPWQVSLQTSDGSHFCGGSLYSENIVITAAHCVQGGNLQQFKVRVGSTTHNAGGQQVNVAAVKTHENYSTNTMVNDIAILRLETPVTLSRNVKPIKLATKAPPSRANAAVTGWGTTALGADFLPLTLQTVTVKMVSREECASDTYGYGNMIQPTMICAYTLGKDSCQGDSGGPLVSGGRLVGVVSWGKGCAFPNYPGVYADVAHLNSWILETVAELTAL